MYNTYHRKGGARTVQTAGVRVVAGALRTAQAISPWNDSTQATLQYLLRTTQSNNNSVSP